MLPFAVATLHGHSECFRELESVLETLESRRQHFETRDDSGRTFLHLAALAGLELEIYNVVGAGINDGITKIIHGFRS